MRNELVKIRKADVNDYSVCLPLFTILYHGDIGPDFKQTFEGFVNNRNSVVLLAECSNKVIGILVGSYHLDIDWEGRIAKIGALIVDEAYRKKRIGRKLVACFITMARRERCKAIRSRVNVKNVVAQKFHESLGFVKANIYEYFLGFQEQ